jgi:hypothetical protein
MSVVGHFSFQKMEVKMLGKKSRKRKAEGLERHKQIKKAKKEQKKKRTRIELPAKHRRKKKK